MVNPSLVPRVRVNTSMVWDEGKTKWSRRIHYEKSEEKTRLLTAKSESQVVCKSVCVVVLLKAGPRVNRNCAAVRLLGALIFLGWGGQCIGSSVYIRMKIPQKIIQNRNFHIQT